MEPVKQVIRFRTEIELHVADRVPSIGEKLDLLIHLEALGLEQLEQPAFGLLVIGLDKGKALDGRIGLLLTAPERQYALARNDLEPALLSALRLDVPAVNANGQRTVWRGELAPVAGAALNKRHLFVAQLIFQTLRQGADVVANRHGLQWLIEGQHVLQEFHTAAIRGQGGPFGLQVEQLRRSVLGQEFSQWAETLGLMGLTGTMSETGTVHRQVAKDRAKHNMVGAFAVAELATLCTVALGVEVLLHLPCHHHGLHTLENGLTVRNR